VAGGPLKPSFGSSGGLPRLCTVTTEAAPPFAVFEGWAPRTMYSGDLANVTFGSRVRPILFGATNHDEVEVRGTANELHRSLRQAQGRLFVGSRLLCVRLRFLDDNGEQQVPHRAFSPIRNDIPFWPEAVCLSG
jgi:hypothetical protein